jgi:hypothetical protein
MPDNFGSSFVQGFGQMMQVVQGQQALKQQAEETKLRSKLLDMHVEEFKRKALAGETLKGLLTAQQPLPEAGYGGPSQEFGQGFSTGDQPGFMVPQAMQPKPFTIRDLATALTPVDPEGAVKLFIDQEKSDREQRKQDQSQAFAERLVGQVLPGGLGTATGGGQAAPAAAAGAPAAAQPAAEGQPLRSGAPQFEGFTLDPTTGKLNLKFGESKLEIKDSNVETSPGSGIFYHRRDFIDGRTGGTVGTQVLGRPTTGEGMTRAEAMVRSWGLNPLTELGQNAIGDVFSALAFQGSEEQNIALDRTRQKYQTLMLSGGAAQKAPAGGGPAGGVAGTTAAAGSVLEEARSQRVRQTERETRARETAQREEQPPQAADRNRLIQLQSIERQGNIVRDTFRPEFVGKGFKAFSGDLKKEYEAQEKAAPPGSNKYASGALPGTLRKYLGKAAPEEVQFRSALLDMSDLLLRARSGAQINEQEYQRLKALLPDLYDEPNTFIPALRRFTTEAGKQLDDTLKLGGSSMKQLQEERAQSKKKPQFRYDPKADRLVPMAP